MEQTQAVAILNYAHEFIWPKTSALTIADTYATLAITMGTGEVPVFVLIGVDGGTPFPWLEINSEEHLGAPSVLSIDDAAILAKLGGTLIQASNLLTQINGLAG